RSIPTPMEAATVATNIADGRNGPSRRSRRLCVAITNGLVQHQRLRDALEFEGTNLDEAEPARRDVVQNVLPDEDLIRPGLRRDAGRDVDRPTEVVTLVVDHRS